MHSSGTRSARQQKSWEDRGRPEDLLWTGTSWREHQVWREHYAGGLSAAEEDFSLAMGAKAASSGELRNAG